MSCSRCKIDEKSECHTLNSIYSWYEVFYIWRKIQYIYCKFEHSKMFSVEFQLPSSSNVRHYINSVEILSPNQSVSAEVRWNWNSETAITVKQSWILTVLLAILQNKQVINILCFTITLINCQQVEVSKFEYKKFVVIVLNLVLKCIFLGILSIWLILFATKYSFNLLFC